MAAEAIYKVKEAEDKGVEMIKSATEEAKAMIKKAETESLNNYKAMIGEANRKKTELIDHAVKKAAENCASMVQQGQNEVNKLLYPDEAKLEKAAEIAIERIVNMNGNR